MERTPSIEELIRIVSNITSSIGLEQGTLPTEDHVEPIKQFVASLTPQSLGLAPDAHERITPPALPGNIRYLHIDQVAGAYSIGVFVLPPRACIPLHDHPNMCVVSHVLYGVLKMTCYDRLENAASTISGASSLSFGSTMLGFAGGLGFGGGDARRRDAGELAVLAGSGLHPAPYTSCLMPTKANVHELEAGHQGVAVLDVLIPPYDASCGRNCTYYRADHVQSSVGLGGLAGGGGSWGTGAGGRSAGGSNNATQGAHVVRLVPCTSGDNYAVVSGEIIAPLNYDT